MWIHMIKIQSINRYLKYQIIVSINVVKNKTINYIKQIKFPMINRKAKMI